MRKVLFRLPIVAVRALESLLGRRQLWRLGRLIYLQARRDGPNDPTINGEYALHRKLALLAYQRNKVLNVIDIGANVGNWSSHFLEACKRMGVGKVQLWAFEPSDEIRARLVDQLKSAPTNYQVKIRPEAVIDKTGRAAFDGSSGITGNKRLLTESADATGNMPRIEVPVTTLATILSEEGIEEADFVKSDVEGFDLKVIKGALPLLAERRIGLLQFEYNHCWIETRSQLRDVFDLLKALPYRVCKIVPDGIEGYEAWHPELETYFEANFMLVRDDLIKLLGVREGRFDAYNTFSASSDA